MISCPTVEKRVIRTHYNLATPFYRLLWGRHIHHGLVGRFRESGRGAAQVDANAQFARRSFAAANECSTSAVEWAARRSTSRKRWVAMSRV